MDTHLDKKEQIIKIIQTKGLTKINCFKKAQEVFQELKNLLHEISGDINEVLPNNRALKIEYRDKGKFESTIQFGDDILIFNMHTDIFQFDDSHPVCNQEYSKENDNNTLCAVINVYNLLSNSFKYNREDDEGYLIGRIFINHEGFFFVEGKNLGCYNSSIFGAKKIDEDTMTDIILSMILFTLDFDLLVPEYETVKKIDSDKMDKRVDNSKTDTGKRLNRDFDISNIII